MLLRDFLNEFELDWAQAPVRSGLISAGKLKNAKLLLAGEQLDLQESIAWSFMAWNDAKALGIQAAECALVSGKKAEGKKEDGRLAVTHFFTEGSFERMEADYVILTGLCGCEIPETAAQALVYLERFGRLAEQVCRLNCRRILLLSDTRVYGVLPREFAVSEYEAGKTDPADGGFSAQYLMQAMEGILYSSARASGKSCNILRTGLLYGPGIPMRKHLVCELAEKTAKGEAITLTLSPDRSSYLSIHDLLTAIQFTLTECPENKILNVKGLDSDKSAAELAVLLYQNFPEQCHLELTAGVPERPAAVQGARPKVVAFNRRVQGQQEMQDPKSESEQPGTQEAKHDLGQSETWEAKHDLEQPGVWEAKHDSGQSGVREAKHDLEQPGVWEAKHDLGQSETWEAKHDSGQSETWEAKHDLGQSETWEAKHDLGQSETWEAKHDLGQSGVWESERGIGQKESEHAQNAVLLNTQLIEHYGFKPKINMEDGLIILVKALQNTGEVFIFDNTYLGKLKTVQKILLGYLLEIDRICRKYDIKYFLAGGTLLGAIRHHGFIPWDDDADVMMLRKDYDRFQKVVKKELPDNIFVQLPTTEKGNHNPFMKLRINNTMFATEFTGHFMDMHNGIFFDVLSHDRTGSHRWSQKLHLMVTMLTRSIVFNKWGNTDIKSGGGHPVICRIVDKAKYLVPMPLAEWAQNRSLTFFRNRSTGYLYDGMGRNLKRGSFPEEWLDEAVYVDFEGYRFPVPKEYDKYLTYLYGDYMQMIPVSERRTSHSIVLTDLGAYADFKLAKQEENRSENDK